MAEKYSALVKDVTIERCFGKCGFLDTIVDAQDEDKGLL